MHRLLQVLLTLIVTPWYAAFIYAVYPAFTVFSGPLFVALSLLSPVAAVVIGYVLDVHPLDVGKHFLVTLAFLSVSLSLLRAGVVSPIPGVAPVLIYRTFLWLVPVVLACYVVFELDLLDRDGPLGERLGLVEVSE